MKSLYFIITNGYNMVVSIDDNNKCRYLTETEKFPYIINLEKEEQIEEANKFLEKITDDSSWNDDVSYDELFTDNIFVLTKIEKEV